MRRLCVSLFVILLATSTKPGRAEPYYFYSWNSPKPVNPASIRIDIEGGTVIENYISDDRLWGTVHMDAPRECLFMTWHSETESGIGMYDHKEWDLECDRIFIPLVAP